MTFLLHSKIGLVFSVITLFNMGLQTFYKLSPQSYYQLNALDNSICILFFTNFVYYFYESTDKKGFFKKHWIDFLLCVPFTQGIWFQYHSVLRLLRSIRSLKFIHDFMSKDNNSNKFVDCCVVGVAFILFSTIAVFNAEKHLETANIKNLSDSLWWAMATVTTIGYGDRFPVSDLGRIIGGFVMILGVGLYASFTGFIVSKFVNDERVDQLLKDNEEMKTLLREIAKKNVDKPL
jgi:voltage-gated potassium channel